MTDAEVLFRQPAETDRFLPEGPREVVVDGRQALAWVNIQTSATATSGEIHLLFADGEHRRLSQAKRPGFLIPTDRPNVVLVGADKAIGLVDLATNHWTPLATIDDPCPFTTINDGEPTPDCRAVVFGTKDVRFQEPIGHLYLYTPDDNRVTVLADGQTCSNGKVFEQTDDGLFLFDIDTPKRNIVRYRLDIERRTLTLDGPAIDLSMIAGFPDGMVDGGNGTFVVAFYNPDPVADGLAIRIDRTGGIIEEWRVPQSPRVTCPLLVRRDNRIQLILTTATEGMPEAIRNIAPDAGNLFIAPTTLDNISVPSGLKLNGIHARND
jgi:sugar lactone lactonase YvrE